MDADTDRRFTPEVFRDFIHFDVGQGPPLYWHSIGRLYRAPLGEVICQVEALISNRLVRLEENYAEAVCRTLLIYRDEKSGEIVEHEGKPQVREYPYIVARFRRHARALTIDTEGLSGPHHGRYGVARVTAEHVYAHTAADTSCFYWTLFGAVHTPSGPVRFVEAYNGTTAPAVMVMNRSGTLPAFAGPGEGLLQTTARSYDNFAIVPRAITDYVEQFWPEHALPPADMADVDRLRLLYLGR